MTELGRFKGLILGFLLSTTIVPVLATTENWLNADSALLATYQ